MYEVTNTFADVFAYTFCVCGLIAMIKGEKIAEETKTFDVILHPVEGGDLCVWKKGTKYPRRWTQHVREWRR